MNMDHAQCHHEDIVVDYDHPHGLIRNVAIRELQASPKELTRPFMTLLNPRCGICGKDLLEADLTQRLQRDGDLYDERFIFTFT
jgi:hypothetical protein